MKPQPIPGNRRYSITVDGALRVDGVPLRCVHCDEWLTLDHVADAHGRPCSAKPPRMPRAKPKASIVAQESANRSEVESSPARA
jgi:hypothetical protein